MKRTAYSADVGQSFVNILLLPVNAVSSLIANWTERQAYRFSGISFPSLSHFTHHFLAEEFNSLTVHNLKTTRKGKKPGLLHFSSSHLYVIFHIMKQRPSFPEQTI